MPNSGTKTKIVFFGSGPVAASSLKLLTKSFDIEAVVTKPRPSHHRGTTPVLDLTEELGLAIIEASSKVELSDKIKLAHFESRVAILIDFGIIVSQDVIDKFPLGIINSHFSLLPEWRGADPITFAILSGQKRTGVSLMLLVEAMDEGPIIAFGVEELAETITTPILTEKLIGLSYALLKDTVPGYIDKGEKKGIPQSDLPKLIKDLDYPNRPTYSHKLTKDDGILDFTKPATRLEREIRAYIEWPKSRTTIADKDVVVTAAHVNHTLNNEVIGKVFVKDKKLNIQTSDGVLVIDRLKPAGKPDMSATAFLAGYAKDI